MNAKLVTIIRIGGKINVVTGLHIGGSAETMEIGGLDNPIIRNPANEEPYIPGSSLKGKMRSLMEWHLARLSPSGDTHQGGEDQRRLLASDRQLHERRPRDHLRP